MADAEGAATGAGAPLSWRMVKPLIRATIGAAFLPLGFANPGVRMWRHRPHFIDVIEARPSGSLPRWTITLGCQPRLPGRYARAAASCVFQTGLGPLLGGGDGWLDFAPTVAEQERRLAELAPLVAEGAERWFALFATSQSARQALRWLPADTAPPTAAAPGSPAYAAILRSLAELEHQVNITQNRMYPPLATPPGRPRPRWPLGAAVRVRLGERNRTPRRGVVDDIAWHGKEARYHYYIIETETRAYGKPIAKRYLEDDLERAS